MQNACEYLIGGDQVCPKSSPPQGMKAQSLQSLFVGEVDAVDAKLQKMKPLG